MRKIALVGYLLLLGSITLTSCLGEGIEREKTNNSEYDVTFLFEKDGIKVYRFFDGSHAHYFTSSGETMTTDFRGESKREENIKPQKRSISKF
jgi:hypothetical protein